MKTDKDSSKSRGFGFVRFFSSEVQREVQTGEHCIKGRNVELKFPRKVGGACGSVGGASIWLLVYTVCTYMYAFVSSVCHL